MKHLRLFESFISEGFSDPYYREITREDFLRNRGIYEEKRIVINKRIVDQLKSFGFEVSNIIGHGALEMFKRVNTELSITISTIDDDYFLVKEYNNRVDIENRHKIRGLGKWTYYRCDQSEGLLELLKDKKWI